MPFIFLAIAGAAATAGGLAIRAGEDRAAERSANQEFEELQRQQKRFTEEAERNLQDEIGRFKPEERENLRKEIVAENVDLLGEQLARDRGPLREGEATNVSEQFLDKKASLTQGLDLRAQEKGRLLGNVLAPGGIAFSEKEKLLEAGGVQNVNRNLARGQLAVDTNAVSAASIPKRSLTGDLLLAIGPALATAGVAGALAAPAAGALAPSGGLITQGGLVPTFGAIGGAPLAGLSAAEIAAISATGSIGGSLANTTNNPGGRFL